MTDGDGFASGSPWRRRDVLIVANVVVDDGSNLVVADLADVTLLDASDGVVLQLAEVVAVHFFAAAYVLLCNTSFRAPKIFLESFLERFHFGKSYINKEQSPTTPQDFFHAKTQHLWASKLLWFSFLKPLTLIVVNASIILAAIFYRAVVTTIVRSSGEKTTRAGGWMLHRVPRPLRQGLFFYLR